MTTTFEQRGSSPKCVGTTGDSFCKTIADYHAERRQDGRQDHQFKRYQSNLFREAQFSADGTTIVTHSEDQCIRTFVLPTDLLEESEEPHQLRSYCSQPSPSTVQSYALYPRFALENPSTTVALSASKDLPISLFNVVHSDVVHATYPLIHPSTEAYIAPSSLCWTRDGSHFIAGSRDQISVFDSSRDGSAPILTHKTAPGRAEKKKFGRSTVMGCCGIVSALGMSPDGVLAAGTTNRGIALYSGEGYGECATAFSLGAAPGDYDMAQGTGVTQLSWSPCGTYLIIAERQSDAIQVYDMRNTFNRVSWLSGRNANTTQRLGMHVIPTVDGFETWAGGTDGCVRMWKNPGQTNGEHAPDEMMKLHDDPVSSAMWHPGGAVLATSSGKRFDALEMGNEARHSSHSNSNSKMSVLDNRLKIWTV